MWRWLNDRTQHPRFKKRTCPELDDITVPGWNFQLDRELLSLLSVLAGCASIEDSQREILDRICRAPTLTTNDLASGGVAMDQPAHHDLSDDDGTDELGFFIT